MPYFETIHDRIAFIRATGLAPDSSFHAAGPAPAKAAPYAGPPGPGPLRQEGEIPDGSFLLADQNRLHAADFQCLLYLYDHRGIEWSQSPQGTRRVERALPRKGWYHKHEYVEILYVIDGSFDQLLLGQRCHFPQGSFVITDQNCEHSDYIEAIDAAVLFLQLRPEYLDELLRSYPKTDELHRFLLHTLYQQKGAQSFLELSPSSPVPAPLPEAPGTPFPEASGAAGKALELSRLLEQLVREDLGRLPGSEQVCRGLLVRLLHTLCTQYSPVLHSSSREGWEKAFLYEIERYIRLHDKDVTLRSLEQAFHYHRNYFTLLLRKYRGQTFQKYIQGVRLDHALQLLTETSLPIRQIAAAVGYENTSHFYHLFQKRFGMPPREARRGHGPYP